MRLKRVQFNDDFRRRMDHFIKEEYGGFVNNRDVKSTHLARKVTSFFCKFNLFDLESDVYSKQGQFNAENDVNEYATSKSSYLTVQTCKASKTNITARLAHFHRKLLSWPVLFMLCYLLSLVYLWIEIYYHYIHDKYVLHTERFKQAQEHHKEYILADYMLNNVTLDMLLDQAQSTGETLKSFGAPFRNFSFATECSLIFLTTGSFACYINPMLFRKFIDQVDFYILRIFLDPKLVQLDFNETIRSQCNKYILSDCNFTEALVARCTQLNSLKSIDLVNLRPQSELRRLLLEYRNTIRSLKEFALSGRLQPINFSSRWFGKLARYYWIVFPSMIAFSEGFFVVVFFVLPRMLNYVHETDLADLLVICLIQIQWFATDASAVFYINSSILNCIDQMNLINKLMEAMHCCVRENNLIYQQLIQNGLLDQENEEDNDDDDGDEHRAKLASIALLGGERRAESSTNRSNRLAGSAETSAGERARLVARMNENLLFVLMHYKIFVVRLKVIRRHFSMLCLTSLFITFGMPLMGRLHVPYVTTNFKFVIVATSLACLLFADICIAPICSLHAKCLHLYKLIWVLLSHTIELAVDAKHVGRIYDRHTTWMLRKELNHSERLARQFATRALGIEFTYSSLVKIHFWFGLMLLSILADTKSDQEEMIGSLVSDPLRIFSTSLH